MNVCRHCGTSVTISEPIPRDAECSGCGKDLRACVQCRFYDPAYNNSCRETEAEPVVEKDRRNFCEFFSFARGPLVKEQSSGREGEARARLEALFGGPAAKPAGGGDARARLEALFRGSPPAPAHGGAKERAGSSGGAPAPEKDSTDEP